MAGVSVISIGREEQPNGRRYIPDLQGLGRIYQFSIGRLAPPRGASRTSALVRTWNSIERIFLMKLTDYKALTFDCYGTLIDWESGMTEGLKPLTSKLKTALPRNAVLEAHARHESAQQEQTPGKRYRDLLPIVYKRLAEEWGLRITWAECVQYGQSVRDWPAFPDTAGALQYLKNYFKLVILSNVDNESFSFSNQKLGVSFDAIYTAEDVGSYKPA